MGKTPKPAKRARIKTYARRATELAFSYSPLVYSLSASPFIPTSPTKVLNGINGEKQNEYNHTKQPNLE
jgi:hypothetical protein